MIERKPLPARDVAPRHVAIIMDGNRRWARERGLSTADGHRAGGRALRETVRAAALAGIDILTVFAFSEENWKRPAAEVDALMTLVASFALQEAASLAEHDVRVRVIGRREALPEATRAAVETLEALTAACTGTLLNLALNYGARVELADAVRALAIDVQSGRLAMDAIDEDVLANYLYTAGLPDPDLLIRTGGEMRVSNFLLYQIAYAELWSTPVAWPDFDRTALDDALREFGKRQRRFGT